LNRAALLGIVAWFHLADQGHSFFGANELGLSPVVVVDEDLPDAGP
jgi:hypothetical protein